MFRDPFGGLDWDAIRQFLSATTFLLFVVSFAASTSGKWSDPYYWIWGHITNNSAIVIILIMFSMMALWWYEQFNEGRY